VAAPDQTTAAFAHGGLQFRANDYSFGEADDAMIPNQMVPSRPLTAGNLNLFSILRVGPARLGFSGSRDWSDGVYAKGCSAGNSGALAGS